MEGNCIHRNKTSDSIQTCDLADLPRNCQFLLKDSFLKRFITQRVYTVCTRINYKTVFVASLNKYLHYGINGTQ